MFRRLEWALKLRGCERNIWERKIWQFIVMKRVALCLLVVGFYFMHRRHIVSLPIHVQSYDEIDQTMNCTNFIVSIVATGRQFNETLRQAV